MSIEQKSVVITSAVRTAIGTFRGSLKNLQGHELGSVVIKESIKRSNLKLNDVNSDEVIKVSTYHNLHWSNTHQHIITYADLSTHV